MLDVVEVVPELIPNLVHPRRVALHHLRPARDAGPDHVAVGKEWHLPGVPLRQYGRLRPGANKAHLTPEDVPELGQLIEPIAADDTADASDAVGLVATRKVGAPVVDDHAPELQHTEGLPQVTYTLLDEEGTAGAVEYDAETDEGHDRDQQRQHGKQEGDVNEPLEFLTELRGRQLTEVVLVEVIELHPPADGLADLTDLIDRGLIEGAGRQKPLPHRAKLSRMKVHHHTIYVGGGPIGAPQGPKLIVSCVTQACVVSQRQVVEPQRDTLPLEEVVKPLEDEHHQKAQQQCLNRDRGVRRHQDEQQDGVGGHGDGQDVGGGVAPRVALEAMHDPGPEDQGRHVDQGGVKHRARQGEAIKEALPQNNVARQEADRYELEQQEQENRRARAEVTNRTRHRLVGPLQMLTHQGRHQHPKEPEHVREQAD